MEKFKYSTDEVADLTGESRSVIESARDSGDLKMFKVGRRWFATPDAVRKWVAKLEKESDKGKPVSYRSDASLERIAKLKQARA